MAHTHVGYRREVGHIHAARLYGHADYRGRTHALNGTGNIYSGAVYKALCGKTVTADHDGDSFNIRPATGSDVSCKRCQRLAAKES